MRAFALKIVTGVYAVLMGVSLLIFIGTAAERFEPSLEPLGLIPLFVGIGIGVALFVTASFQHLEFQRSHPYIQDFYTADERRETQRSFAASLVAGLFLLFAGVVGAGFADGRGELAEGVAAGLLIALLAASAWLIVRGSMLLSRVNVSNYNEAREQAIAESDAWKWVREADAAQLRACTPTSRSASCSASPTHRMRKSPGLERAWSGAIARASLRAACAALS